jgi:CRP-like cAMP-binding protein
MRGLIRRHLPTHCQTGAQIHVVLDLNGQGRQLADLAGVAFLADCTREQRERIASLSTTLDVSAGRRLCRAGSTDRQFLVVVEGEATVTVAGADVATLGPGCGFGVVAVLTPDGRRGAAVTAATPVTLLAIHPGEFDTLAREVPSIVRRVQDETASRLSKATANNKQPAPRRLGLSKQARNIGAREDQDQEPHGHRGRNGPDRGGGRAVSSVTATDEAR